MPHVPVCGVYCHVTSTWFDEFQNQTGKINIVAKNFPTGRLGQLLNPCSNFIETLASTAQPFHFTIIQSSSFCLYLVSLLLFCLNPKYPTLQLLPNTYKNPSFLLLDCYRNHNLSLCMYLLPFETVGL